MKKGSAGVVEFHVRLRVPWKRDDHEAHVEWESKIVRYLERNGLGQVELTRLITGWVETHPAGLDLMRPRRAKRRS